MPKTVTVPEDLSRLSVEELEELQTQIREAAKAADDSSDEGVAELELLAEQYDSVEEEKTRKADKASERTERADSARARIGTGEAQGNGDGTEPAGPAPAAETETETEVEATGGDGGEEEEEEEEEQEPAGHESGQTPVPVPAAASTKPNAGALKTRLPKAAAPRTGTDRRDFMFGTGAGQTRDGVELPDRTELAKTIAQARYSSQFTRIPQGVDGEYVSIAQGTKQFEQPGITADPLQNFMGFYNAREEHNALVAAGECCTPLSPLYDFFRLAEAQNPVETSLNVMQAPRGGIRYIGGNCSIAAAMAAVDVLCCGDNDDPLNPVLKACARVGCPEVLEELVCSVSQCLYFDNLQYRTFPELVEDFLEDVAVAFTSRKEVFYLDRINTESTPVSATIGYGASRNLFHTWVGAAVAYRKRHRMARGSTLQVLAPDWAIDAIKLDMAMDHSQGLNYFNVSDADVQTALRNQGLDVTWINDNVTGHNNQFRAPQNPGTLNQWPTVVTSFIYAPGTFVRLDGGTLDVGLVRDSQLNRTNDLQLFMEEWIGLAFLGCESIRLSTGGVCTSGAAVATDDTAADCTY